MIPIYKTPQILSLLAPNLTWKVKTDQKVIYLTFDDGPVPGLTDYVLDELKNHDALATFFCVGENIHKYPETCQKIIDHGHLIGNHTYNHLKGWSTKNELYFTNIDKCQAEIERFQHSSGRAVFRPPHGQITRKQVTYIRKKYQIVMWDILTYDYQIKLAPPQRLDKIIKKTSPGTIIVFHDNFKGEKNLRYLLPRYLYHFKNIGFKFKKLDAH